MEKKKISYNDFTIQLSSNKDHLEFDNCIFESGLVLNNNQRIIIDKRLTFKNCEFAKLDFVSCDFKGQIYFHACTFLEGPAITNCNFTERFIGNHLKANAIRIWNNNFLAGCDIMRYECKEEAIFQFHQVTGRINVSQEKSAKILSVNKTHIQFDIIREASIIIENISSKNVQLGFPGQMLEYGVSLLGIEADSLEILLLKSKSENKINIERINADKITFYELHNDGWLTLKNLRSLTVNQESFFRVQNSYFGNSEFYHVDFAGFSKIQIFNCHLQNIVPVNVNWNFDIKAYEGINNEYLRELFRQLKNVCSKNMDKIGQLRFERLEMHFYNKQLHWWWNFGDWIIFKSNRYSNDYGQNWLLAAFWLFSFSFALYTFLNYCSGNFSCYHIGNYLNFVMPFHSLKDILCGNEKATQNNWLIFWDVLQRIISSYFIFQFLRAFRKYVN